MMWKFAAFSRRFSARYCMLIAATAGLVRWSLSTLEMSAILLFVLQTLHALTYGLLFVATVNFIGRRVDDSIAAKAQSLYATLTTGALALAVMVSGVAYERVGILGYWIMAIMCAVGAVFVLASFTTNLEDETPLVG
jgi:PPP family 3-phenylpropionic acid transporter